MQHLVAHRAEEPHLVGDLEVVGVRLEHAAPRPLPATTTA
jgi:hypothetical protein